MNKVILLILDGLALGEKNKWNAFEVSNAVFLKNLLSKGIFAKLKTFGRFVGLPDGQIGNSEVGHMNLGAGRIVKQQQVLIDEGIEDLSIFRKSELDGLISSHTLNVVMLVSSGGVHSHVRHLVKFDQYLETKGVKGYLHIITDGRDTPPKSFLNDWTKLKLTSLEPVTIIGRYYAMDRDKRWDRTEIAYRLIMFAEGDRFSNLEEAVDVRYSESRVTDEFLPPSVFGNYSGIVGQDNPLLLFLNFREDRMRQLAAALCEDEFAGQFSKGREYICRTAFSLTQYDKHFRNLKPLYIFSPLTNTLGEVLSKNGIRQLRIAETEKYPHVTYFFNGGREDPFEGEDRVLIPSPKDVPTYDKKPQMSVYEVTRELEIKLESEYQFVVCNFANCDMVGHTGVLEAAVKACEAVDECVERVCRRAKSLGWTVIITADHGNCEQMWDELNHQPHTAHTANDVFFIGLSPDGDLMKFKAEGLLGSVAPTILDIYGIPKPVEMTAASLLCEPV